MKNILHKLKIILFNIYYELSWFFSSNRKNNNCLNTSIRKNKIIVSLTTFPGRINIVHKAICSILNQKEIKPDEIELWLANEQFENKEQDLPIKLLNLKKYGLKICWCEDIKSYKKLIPTLRNHPNDIIVTADDDVYYNTCWLEKLYNSYLIYPKHIYCHRVTKFYIKDNEYKTIPGGYSFYKIPAYLNKLVGIGGVLYPPKSLYKDILDKDIFMKYANTNDDIWFWFMAILNNTKISVVKKNVPMPIDIVEALKTERLTQINDGEKKMFWIQFNNLIKLYPNIDTILRTEYKELMWREYE